MNQYFTFKQRSWGGTVIGEVIINLKYLVSVRYSSHGFVNITLTNGEKYSFRDKNKELEAVLNKYDALSK